MSNQAGLGTVLVVSPIIGAVAGALLLAEWRSTSPRRYSLLYYACCAAGEFALAVFALWVAVS
jgi:hypothetical protein